MRSLFRNIVVLVFAFYCSSSFSMRTAPPFFEEVKRTSPSEIKACINKAFLDQSKIIPSRHLTKGGDIVIGDIVTPTSTCVIDFEQAVRNSAKHMVESGHMGWFAELTHSSAKSWPSFFLPRQTTYQEAERLAQELLRQIATKNPLTFVDYVRSGDDTPKVIGVDFIADAPCQCVAFKNGYGKPAPERQWYKKPKKDLAQLIQQNADIEAALFKGSTLASTLSLSQPVVGNKVILRIAFRENPMYRDMSTGTPVFLKYTGFIIDFLSLYPIFQESDLPDVVPSGRKNQEIIQTAISLFERGDLDGSIDIIFENIGTDYMHPKEAFMGIFKVADGESDRTNFMGLLAASRGRDGYVEKKSEFLEGLIATLRTKL